MQHIAHNYMRLIILQSIIIGMLLFPIELMADDFYVEHMTSPQVSDMFRYGNVETSLFTGKLNFAIPIYSLEDPDFDLDIALRYNSEGFKPTKQSGYVGYGWFLEAGGCITREVKGYADEFNRKHYPEQSWTLLGMLTLLNDEEISIDKDKVFEFHNSEISYCTNCETYHFTNCSCYADVDYLPDIFHFNFCGYHGSFIINNNGGVTILNGDFVQVDLTGLVDVESNTGETFDPNAASCISITTKDGYKYIFGGDTSALEYSLHAPKEPVSAQNFPSQNAPTINTWHLREIIATNGRTIKFYHKPFFTINLYQDPLWSLNMYYDIFAKDDIKDCCEHIQYNMTKECIIDSIIVNGSQSLKIAFCNSYDTCKLHHDSTRHGNYKLDTIQVYSNNRILRSAVLTSSYTHSVDAQGKNANYWRFLSSVNIIGIGKYSLTYHSGTYPHIGEYDAWYQNTLDSDGYYVNTPTLGLLSEVIYPTGGKQTFSYENNNYSEERRYRVTNAGDVELQTITSPIGYIAGIRIQKIETYTGGTLVERKTYSYKKPNLTTSSGIYYNLDKTYYREDAHELTKNSYSLLNTHIGYSHVEETTNMIVNGESHKVAYSFDTGIRKYTSYNSSYIKTKTEHLNDSPDTLAAALSGALSYDSKLNTIGHLLTIDYYVGSSLQKSHSFKYNGIENSTTLLPTTPLVSLGCTDTIVLFSVAPIPVTRKMFVYSPVCETQVTKDFSGGNHVYTCKNIQHDRKFRIKKETTTNSDGMTYFTKYTYPDEFNFSNMSTVGLYPSPYALLKKRNQISEPIETISGYMDGDQEKVTSGRINLFNTNRLIVPNDSRRVLGGSVVVDSNLIIIPDSMILQTQPYPVLYKNLDLHIANSINDYQPISVVNDSLRYDSRYRLTCTYEFDSMLRLTSITPVNNVTTSYTWDGIYPVSKTVGNQTSTFSYIPYVGMSSMTDARGVTTYYAYDTYGRLIEVYRQHNTHGKEILNHYIYHTKTE
jgi:hypothetical protein